jgi:hypothetical protein
MQTVVLTIISCITVINVIICVFNIKALLSLEKRLAALEAFNPTEIDDTPEETIGNDMDVAAGLMKDLSKIKSDEDKFVRLLEMARKAKGNPLSIMNNNSSNSSTVYSDGNLIPQNLTSSEREVLNQFYGPTEK